MAVTTTVRPRAPYVPRRHSAMLHIPRSVELQTAERLQEVLEGEAFVGLNLVERRRRGSADIERAEDL
jgi:hypothetical protein